MAKVYVNLMPDGGLPLTATIAKSGTREPTVKRTSAWSAAIANKIVDADAATFTDAAPTETAAPNGDRVFSNNIQLPPTGGNQYTVTVKKKNATRLGSKTANVSSAGNATAGGAAAAGQQIQLEAVRKVYFGLGYMRSLRPYYDLLKTKIPELFASAGIEFDGPTADAVVIDDVDGARDTAVDSINDVFALAEAKPASGDPKKDLWVRIGLVKAIKNKAEPKDLTLSAIANGSDARLVHEGAVWGFKVTAADDAKAVFFSDAISSLSLRFANPLPPLALAAGDVVWTADTQRSVAYLYAEISNAGAAATVVERLSAMGSVGTMTVTFQGEATARTLVSEKAEATAAGAKITFRGAAPASLVADGMSLAIPRAISPVVNNGPATAVAITAAEDRKSMVVRFASAAVNRFVTEGFAAAAGGALTIQAGTRPWTQFAGLTKGGNILIAVDSNRARYKAVFPNDTADQTDTKLKAALARIAAHELCHVLQGPRTAERGLNHPNWYPGTKGGTASDPVGHCKFNAEEVAAATLKASTDDLMKRLWEEKKPLIVAPKSGKIPCIMFHSLWPRTTHDSVFCADCIKQLRAQDLSKPKIPGPMKIVT